MTRVIFHLLFVYKLTLTLYNYAIWIIHINFKVVRKSEEEPNLIISMVLLAYNTSWLVHHSYHFGVWGKRGDRYKYTWILHILTRTYLLIFWTWTFYGVRGSAEDVSQWRGPEIGRADHSKNISWRKSILALALEVGLLSFFFFAFLFLVSSAE